MMVEVRAARLCLVAHSSTSTLLFLNFCFAETFAVPEHLLYLSIRYTGDQPVYLNIHNRSRDDSGWQKEISAHYHNRQLTQVRKRKL